MGDYLGGLGGVAGAYAQQAANEQDRYRAQMGNYRRFYTKPNAKAARALLGVSATATPDDIKAAFRTAVRAAHPDNGGTGADMDALTRAKELLLTTMTESPGQNSAANAESACKLCNGVGTVSTGFGSLPCQACRGTGNAL